ncbi:SAM-dependent methyltransferase [uncultured Marinobacter sp.]|uniref:SAM-dependent methyltransferase n=1 Tax=uncultured Marinobacter sp. TaxID=187379 RepID=UPI0026190D42|nr:SAM-dependent methyltransferase [uncultured Marinobacter sp.]
MRPNKPSSCPDTSPEFFDRLYQNSQDPWDFRHSMYERARYRAIVEAVNDRRYKNAFEPGCAIGELTAMLAPFCESLRAIDCSVTAVEIARSRCREFPNIDIRQGELPEDLPKQTCDLIVFSEVGYYFSRQALASLIARLWLGLEPSGRLIACHWLGHSKDHKLHGTAVHDALTQVLGASDNLNAGNDGYILQRWSKEER